jgi:hypothetical protein
MRILKDDGVNESPTRANILSAMNWLTEGAQVRLKFHITEKERKISLSPAL